jgi:hypothetical protein
MTQTLPAIAVAVARELGDGWTPDLSAGVSHWYGLNGPNGARITLNTWDRPGRITIYGCVDSQHEPYGAPKFKITVSEDTATKKIAQGITRRILNKGYWDVLSETARRKASWERAEAEQEALTEALVKILGPSAHRLTSSPNIVRAGGAVHTEARVTSGSVEFSVTVTAEQAQRFASMIAAISQEKVTVHG